MKSFNEKKLEELIEKIDNNSAKYIKDVIKLILYSETGVWKGNKPTGEWLKKRIVKLFEEPVVLIIKELKK